MILRHKDWDENKELQKSMTVGQFVKEIVLTEENKEYIYFSISLREDCDGKRDLIIYYQNGIVKSHHSTGIEFDYKEVLGWEIFTRYSKRTIRTEDIISMQNDFEKIEKSKSLTKEESDRALRKLFIENENEAIEKSIRKNIFNANAGKMELVSCVQQLVKDLEEQNSINSDFINEIFKGRAREDILQQQIKWLEYRLNMRLKD